MGDDNEAHEGGDKSSWWGWQEKSGEGSQGCSPSSLKQRRLLIKKPPFGDETYE